VSVYLPVFPPAAVPEVLADPALVLQLKRLRERVEGDAAALAPIRAVLDPLEAELWEEADDLAPHPERCGASARVAAERFASAVATL
jgi:hypothetical protein